MAYPSLNPRYARSDFFSFPSKSHRVSCITADHKVTVYTAHIITVLIPIDAKQIHKD